ncbi:MAG: hypothetical protein Q8M94_04155 [Ignavibacteria bacterium]|nr:hypothetical protein [Ignavibacteria bacterium]
MDEHIERMRKIMYIKEKILDILKNDNKTIYQLCNETGIDDEFRMVCLIAELEIEKRICLKEWTKFYDNTDGDLRIGFLAKYGLIDACNTSTSKSHAHITNVRYDTTNGRMNKRR